MELDKNQEAFFTLLRAGLWEDVMVNGEGFMVNGSPLTISDGVDWNKVLDLAEEQSVVGLLAAGIEAVQGAWLKVHGAPLVPKPMALQFVGRTVQLEQRNQAMNYFIGVLVDKMREAGIETVLVKGQGVAQCYERPLWRACGDVDFFLSDDNYEQAKAFLTPLASEVETEYKGSKHLGMTIDPWVVELHGRLYSGLSARIERELDAVQRETFEDGKVRIWKDGETEVPMLAVENDVLYVFTHILQHFYKGGIGMRQICDWCRLLWTYRGSIDVALLEQRLRKMGLMSEWKAFYALAVFYLGLPFTVDGLLLDGEKELERYRQKADRIMEFVLKAGNMGHNRGMSHFSKKPYLVRKCVSMGRRVGDLINHARIFPMDSLRFFPSMLVNGVRSAVNGE